MTPTSAKNTNVIELLTALNRRLRNTRTSIGVEPATAWPSYWGCFPPGAPRVPVRPGVAPHTPRPDVRLLQAERLDAELLAQRPERRANLF